MSTQTIDEVVSDLAPIDQEQFRQLVKSLIDNGDDEESAKKSAYYQLFCDKQSGRANNASDFLKSSSMY